MGSACPTTAGTSLWLLNLGNGGATTRHMAIQRVEGLHPICRALHDVPQVIRSSEIFDASFVSNISQQ